MDRSESAQIVNGRYRLGRTLGKGGTGKVFLAEDLAHEGRQVAVKMLRSHALSQRAIDSLKLEFTSLARLRHPNLVEVHDFGVVSGTSQHFLTMEYVPGPSLLGVGGPLHPSAIRALLLQVCRALDFIHARGFLHQDLKPGNLLLDSSLSLDAETVPTVKLADFGLAVETEAARQEELAGTLCYLAPERLQGKSADRRSDLYSLGAVLFHMLTGRAPFQELEGTARMNRILNGPAPEPGEGAPAELRTMLRKLMDPQPGLRYPSALAVTEAIEAGAGSSQDGTANLVRHAPLVGRAEEVDRIEHLLSSLEEDYSEVMPAERLLAIRGETGIGKTRLMDEARVRARISGVEVMEGDFASPGGPMGPWPELLQRLVGKLQAEPGDAALADDEARDLLHDLAPLLPEPPTLTAGPERPTLSPDAEKQRLLSAVAGLVRLGSKRFPILLCLENLPQAEPLPLEVLRRLALSPANLPLRIIVTLREEELSGSAAAAALQTLVQSGAAVELKLLPLKRDDVCRMLSAMVGLAEPPPALLDLLERQAGGNPLLVEEAMRSLLEDGALVRAAEGLRLDARLAQVGAPADAAAWFSARLGRLVPGERRVLEALAVAGRPTTAADLAAATGVDEDQVRAALASLTGQGLLQDEELTHDFRHAIAGKAAYDGCDGRRRRSLHLRFARLLEKRARVEPGELARHFAGAGQKKQALRWAHRAARQAVRLHAYERASDLYTRALQLEPEGPSELRVDLEEGLAGAQERIGASQRAVEALQRALDALPAPDVAREAALYARLGWNASMAGDYERAAAATESALERYRRAGDAPGEAEARKNLGVAHARQGDYDGAQECYETARSIYEDGGDDEGLASVLNNLGLLRSFRGDHAGAVELLERALSIRDAMKDRRGRLGTLINLGFVKNREESYEAAAQVLESSERLARELGDLQNAGNALMFRAESLRALGSLDGALGSLESALRIHQETGDVARQVNCHDWIGDLHRILGDIATAAEHHRRALELARGHGDPVQEAFALASLGLDRLGLGDPEASGDLEEALRSGRSAGNRRVEARALRGLALVEAMRGSWREMAAKADRLILVAEAGDLAEERVWGQRLMGEAQLGLDEMEAGRRTLQETRLAARGLRRPELEREVLLLLANSYAVGGRAGDALEARQQAQAVLEEMAMKIEDEGQRRSFRAAAGRPAAPPPGRLSGLTESPTHAAEPDRSRGLGAIYEISQAINSILEPQELLETVMDLAIGKLDADRGLIILFDGPGGEMRARLARNMERETIDDALAYSRHVVEQAAEGRPVRSLDAAHDDRFKDFRSVRLHGIRSLLCVPLMLRGKVVGTVYLDSRRAGVAFDEEDLQFLEVFANMAALALHNAREFDGLRRENKRLQEEVKGRFSYANIIGKSPRMQAVFDLVDKVADSTLPVLIYGESGTGKELVARAIHFNGPRKEARFFSENCAAINENLLESELFGHVRGAYTGAHSDRQGVFELASGGTLFLDEIGDMSPALQGKVLRAIQEGEIRPVGGKNLIKVDVRILSATNKDLDVLMQEGNFREDLYYRLNVVKLTLPPLRDRKEDVPLLVDHFLRKCAEQTGKPEKRMDVDALSLILRYSWPGNVRELENEVNRLAVFADGDVITVDDINRYDSLFNKLTDLMNDSQVESMEEVERRQIIRALQETGGHRGQAAAILGISRATIFRKIKQHKISS